MVFYTTREQVMSAPEIKATAYNNKQIDSAIESGSRAVEGLLHRKFYPVVDTRYFDYPNDQRARVGRLWLGEDEVVSITSITSGGTTISSDHYFLEPANSGPPYQWIDLDRADNATFSVGATYQRNIAIAGTFCGCALEEVPGGTTVEALDSSETQVDVSDVSNIGVGSILRIDTERMIVTEKSWLSSSQTLQDPLIAQNNDVTVQVTDGTVFFAGETVLLDSERMRVVDVAGNNLTVKRAVDGSVLATHTGSTIYVPRTLTVERGALGTTAASHNSGASIAVHDIPGLVQELAAAYAIDTLQQRNSGYARTTGSGSNRKDAGGIGIEGLEKKVYAAYGRKARMVGV